MKRSFILASLCTMLLLGCSPVKTTVTNQYQLTKFSIKHFSPHKKFSILVSLPDAVAGYKSEQMLYVKKPYGLASFVYNSWASPPADMLYPLIVQSLQHSGYFYAVVSNAFGEVVDYRLDTQLIRLHQSFLTKPSRIELLVKVVLTDLKTSRVLASKTIGRQQCSPTDSPYGGVMAANTAVESLTAAISEFVIQSIQAWNSGMAEK